MVLIWWCLRRGFRPSNDILAAAQKKKIPIISEIELAYRFIRVPIIAVTGTNGKTTTTTLLGRILAHAGKKVFVGGNIGNPLIEYAGSPQTDDFIVAEISSFQLQWIRNIPSACRHAAQYYVRSCQLSRIV